MTSLPLRTLLALALAATSLPACGGDDDGAASGTADTGTGGRTDTGPRADVDDEGPEPDPDLPCDLRPCGEQPNGGLDNDYDGDGIPDCIEGGEDASGNGVPNCMDLDSDGDGIPDAVEGYEDADGDGVPNFLDLDSDGDGILDRFEGADDEDGDGIPNFLDLDSDGDGWSDTLEYGRPLNLEPGPPLDRDGDGVPDFLDLDSDGDGLPDADEQGCPGSTERTRFDSDNDGVSDLLEVTFGSDPCDPSSDLTGLVDFFFVLPYLDGRERGLLDFGTDLQLGDVVFNMDTTGSMAGPINALRASLSSSIIPGLRDAIPDIAVGVSAFDDFPCGEYGGGNDVPFRLIQRVTTDIEAAQRAVDDGLNLHNGGDTPESGIESLYQLATGAGTNDCRAGIVPAFDPLRNLVAGRAEGVGGGAGFRRGAAPIVVHITDAPSHARGDAGYPYGASRAEAYEAMRDLGMRVIGVSVGANSGRADLEAFARESNAEVPVCAFDRNRPAGCAAGQCCTGPRGQGRAAVGGSCPLVYDTSSDSDALATSVIQGIQSLIQFAPLDIRTVVRGDPEELRRSGINTACLVDSVIPDTAIAGSVVCAVEPEIVDFSGDGRNDGFRNVNPGSLLYFQVEGYNDCVRPGSVPQTFIAYIDVVSGANFVLDTRIVTIVVPPALKDE